jgi:hypothetical protein
MFVFTIGFPAAAAKKITVNGSLEISFRNGEQDLGELFGSLCGIEKVKYLKWKKVGRFCFRATFFKQTLDSFFTTKAFCFFECLINHCIEYQSKVLKP